MDKVKCAIIGYGYMGQIRQKFLKKHKNAEIHLICESNPDLIESNQKVNVISDYKSVLIVILMLFLFALLII